MSMEDRAGHAIQIANIGFGETTTTIYVQNVGEGSLHLDSMAIDEDAFIITASNCTVASQPTTTLEAGRTAAITVNRGYSQKIHIKVVCKDGTFIEGDWTPSP
jgi:archaellum component FlaG (FlaF/FlaG flagellin family)